MRGMKYYYTIIPVAVAMILLLLLGAILGPRLRIPSLYMTFPIQDEAALHDRWPDPFGNAKQQQQQQQQPNEEPARRGSAGTTAPTNKTTRRKGRRRAGAVTGTGKNGAGGTSHGDHSRSTTSACLKRCKSEQQLQPKNKNKKQGAMSKQGKKRFRKCQKKCQTSQSPPPPPKPDPTTPAPPPPTASPAAEPSALCGCPACTEAVRSAPACAPGGGECRTCEARIRWVLASAPAGAGGTSRVSERDACTRVAEAEFPSECGGCHPNRCSNSDSDKNDNDNNNHDNTDDRPPPPNPACTTEGKDPYAPSESSSSGVCCERLNMCLADHYKDGNWHYRCLPSCSSSSGTTTTTMPTTTTTAAPTLPQPPACTSEGNDPYAPSESGSGGGGVCCDGLSMCLADHYNNGNWHYRCYPSCSGTTTTPTPTTSAPPATMTTPPTTMPTASSNPLRCDCTTCTEDVLSDMSACDGGGCYTCGARMDWLRSSQGLSMSEISACTRVANEFPSICGPCNPFTCDADKDPTTTTTTSTYVPPDPSKLVWYDEFEQEDGTVPDPTKWMYDMGGTGWGNNELQFYTDRPNNVHVHKGVLHIRAKRETYQNRQFTSARIKTMHLGDWLYGRFLVRARLKKCTGLGTWPAIWMLPTENAYGIWPSSGEIDIMEHVGFDRNVVHGTVHTEAFNHMIGTQVGKTVQAYVSEWHDYEVKWSPDSIEFVLDGNKYHTFPRRRGSSYKEWPFDQRFHLILNVAVGGNWGGARGVDYAAFDGDGQIMEVDWVRVYSE